MTGETRFLVNNDFLGKIDFTGNVQLLSYKEHAEECSATFCFGCLFF